MFPRNRRKKEEEENVFNEMRKKHRWQLACILYYRKDGSKVYFYLSRMLCALQNFRDAFNASSSQEETTQVA